MSKRNALISFYCSLIFCLLSASATQAEIIIEITQGVDNPTPVAVSPFVWQGQNTLPEDVASIIENDFRFSGLFSLLSRDLMLSYPANPAQVFYRDWRALSQEYLISGEILPLDNDRIEIRC